jgi:2-dehydro-3-deoxy-D-arabinonate dehydratase
VKLYRTSNGPYVEEAGSYFHLPERSWDALVTQDDLHGYLLSIINKGEPAKDFLLAKIEAPIGSQEVWAAGVTYYRSRSARMDESKTAGGGDFYDRVYSAERPELFFKSTPHRVAGPGGYVRIRKDAAWSVPEPELTLLINHRGQIIGYTAGNDMSSRDIEESARAGRTEFSGATTLAELKRAPATLVEYLFRDNSFPFGAFLMTGTGIVPPNSFTLTGGDRIRITIDPIGTLENEVVQGS